MWTREFKSIASVLARRKERSQIFVFILIGSRNISLVKYQLVGISLD